MTKQYAEWRGRRILLALVALLIGSAGHASAAARIDTFVVEHDKSRVEVAAVGCGPLIVMLPSAGRGNEDFVHVAQMLATSGYRVLLPQPRGAGRSSGPAKDVTLHDLADDVAAVIRHERSGPAVVLGHAFGNFVARVAATDHPSLVRGVILAAAGSRAVAGGPENESAARLREVVETLNDPKSSREQRLAALRVGFFAPGNDPGEWVDGWYRAVFDIQTIARSATPPDTWWLAGTAPLLEIQAENDPFKPAEAANEMKDAVGARVTVVRIPHASHALFPEQPERVVETIDAWMRSPVLKPIDPPPARCAK